MTSVTRLMLAAALLATTAMPALADMAKEEGGIFVNEKGMTLYTFDKDKTGESACYDDCAVNWPPLLAASGAKAEGEWSVIERKDGAKQWAYDGKPLYLWIKDTKPGDKTGDGVQGVWHIAKAE